MIKKLLKYFLLPIICLLALVVVIGFFVLRSTAPQYSGEVFSTNLKAEVVVDYDRYGVPHIHGQNSEDVYHTLGFVHAQDRLFQMELIRRLSSGQLAEIFGEKLIETDQLFRTIGIRKMAERCVSESFIGEELWQKDAQAYLNGINEYIDKGKTPVEFSILGIPKTHFEAVDIYCILGYMGLGFTTAMQEDAIFDKVKQNLGSSFFEDWLMDLKVDTSDLKIASEDDLGLIINQDVRKLMDLAKVPIWYGSNAWVVSPEKSKSGAVILANDTHIGISQPSVWYEAYLEYPGYEFYGNYLAGVPFAILGHSRSMGWGLTIFPFDVVDLYREKQNPTQENQVWVNDHWEDMIIENEMIKVKKSDPVHFQRRLTRHGPIINKVSRSIDSLESEPISLWWSFLSKPSNTLKAIYDLGRSTNMMEAKDAVSGIDFIGLNVLYGDVEGNIAHWGAGRIPKRPLHVNSKFILDGASGKDEILGFYDFADNPQTENPAIGFLASANNDPGVVNGNYFSGYYCPENRINRINKYLNDQEKWSQEEMKRIQLDEISHEHERNALLLVQIIKEGKDVVLEGINKDAINVLSNWDGGYEVNQVAPTIYTLFVYNTMKLALEDEFGARDFSALQNSYVYKGSIPFLLEKSSSECWDDISTAGISESQAEIVTKAFEKTMDHLTKQHGKNIQSWLWSKVHTITHEHPLGKQWPLDRFFNVGPFEISGGNDVPNKMMYNANQEGIYKVNSSPALRILLDFGNVEKSESINPTGQSGNIMSAHYKDQAEMFINGIYRPQIMKFGKDSINGGKLVFTPSI